MSNPAAGRRGPMPVLSRLARVARAMTVASPRAARVVVFDREGAEVLAQMALRDVPHLVLDVRGERYYVSARLLWGMARRFIRVRTAAAPGELPGGMRGIAELVWRSYLLACLDVIRPDVVVTYIDNSAAFQWASRNAGRGTFIAVQNGSRLRPNVRDWLPAAPRAGSVISMPHLYCFSRFEPELYARHRHRVDEFHVVGSIRGDFYRCVVGPARRSRAAYDLCVVSEWEASLFRPDSPFPAVGAALTQLYAHLARFLAAHDCRVVVALRSPDPAEHAYFASLLGARATLVPGNRAEMSTYAAMEDSRVILALNSTAAREAFGWGHPVLFCNFTGDEGFGPPRRDPLWLVEDRGYAAFADALQRLLDMPSAEFAERARDAMPYIMHHDCARPAYDAVRAHVGAVLATAAR